MERFAKLHSQSTLFITFSLFFFVSCGIYTPSRITNRFTYCYDGEKTGLDTLLNINGFYHIQNKVNQNLILTESNVGNFHPNFIFYEEGFVHDNPYILLNSEKSKFGLWINNFSGANFGRYILSGDTIKLQMVNPPGGSSQTIFEVWFKIIDKNNIRPIYWGDPDLVSKATLNEYLKNGSYRNEVFSFFPIDNKIKPEKTWIINKKWFRCNE